MHHATYILAALALTSCAPRPEGCVAAGESRALADVVREASGIALSREYDDVVWVHNDSEGGALVYALTTAGDMLGRVELSGAHNRDWEDIAIARCPHGGPEGDCIYVADIGDNRAAREGVGVWVAHEPDPRAETTVDAAFIRVRYPDGPRDAEAIAVLGDGSLLIVSKGREQPVSVYRSAPLEWPRTPNDSTPLTLVQRLSSGPVDLPDQITGATLDRRGRTLGIRSYAGLQFYRFVDDTLAALLPRPVQLDSLGEPQGEGLAMGPRGRVLLVSEAGPQGIAPRLTPLRCRLP